MGLENRIGREQQESAKETLALELGFTPDKYYSAKDKMDMQMKEDGARMRAKHFTS